MKVAVTAKDQTLDSQIDPRFGRCAYFQIIETETMQSTAIENPNSVQGGGAGIQSAQLMAEQDVDVVLTGNCGPNAYRTLDAAGVKVIVGVSGVVREVIENYKAGKLDAVEGPNVAGHFGMNM